ncbi:MAG: 4-(cytidine 5'-diphospho)-2-C-methyl-D-erythritol kinase [Leptolyngbyaceae cyanobacterium bins.59]|nr:4-(cytidine 5'-diphospho)-2-C-methyl-D-erythritol kinase [Leptolyngbyaceae cyanobacterium bins.59]
MRSYSLTAAAKINLYLEIIGDRPDGYHELAMVMQSIDLADRIDLRAIGTDAIVVHCNHPEVPSDERNLAYRAAQLMAQEFPDAYARFGGVEITIQKNIPVGAGLAGGSTNAAAVLVGLDLMWQLGLTQQELRDLGAQLGSDVPFCVSGGTMLSTGRGEQLNPLPDLDALWVVLGKYRSLSVSTVWAYQTYRKQFGASYVSTTAGQEERRQKLHSGPMVSAIAHHDRVQIGQLLYNDLERVVLPEYPQVQQLRDAFQQCDILGTMMSGSGPTVFALTASESQAQVVRDTVRHAIPDPDLELWVAQMVPTSIRSIASA